MVPRSERGDGPDHALTGVRINWIRAAIVVAALMLVLLALALVAFRTARDGVLPRTVVTTPTGDVVEVGGLNREELTTVVQDVAAAGDGRRITLAHGSRQTQASAGELGLGIDIDASVDRLMSYGRQANPVRALTDHVRATVAERRTPLVGGVDEDSWYQVVARTARDLELAAPLGAVAVDADGQVRIDLPPPSEVVDADALRDSTVRAWLTGSAETDPVDVQTTTLEPTLTDDTRGLLEADAERAISAPVTLTTRRRDWTLDTEVLTDLLAVRLGNDDGEDGASVVIDPERLGETLPFDPIALTTAPTDATFDVTGGTPQITPSRTGFVFDIDVAAAQLTELATTVGPRTAELAGQEIEPDLPTEVLAGQGVEREVATFSTDHACCEGRVRNIQRMADLVDGVVVRPGSQFSLNEVAGPRTTANGFVDGGAIESGEFVDQIGGGVSQFTTTLFNAVFFGGYEIEEFQPHSYYIPRYPLGREATLNFDPPIDFRFRNDSPHGILISTSYTDTSITVTLYSTIFAAVESTTSDRYGIQEPEEERRSTTDLPAGEQRVEQSGRDGFSVDFTREITYVDGRRDEQTFTTNYRAQPRIVLVGVGAVDAGGADTAPTTAGPTEAGPIDSDEPSASQPEAPEPVIAEPVTAEPVPPEPVPPEPITPEPVTSEPEAPASQPDDEPDPLPEPGPVDVTPEPIPDQPPEPPPDSNLPAPAEAPLPIDPSGSSRSGSPDRPAARRR